MIKKKIGQKKSPKIEKEDVKKITTGDFDSVMKTILSTPPEVKKRIEKQKAVR